MLPVAVIIPTLNAAAILPATLATVSGRVAEVLVVDGGSTDRTVAILAAFSARIVTAPRGRGPQLAAVAAAVEADWLLFLHADTRLLDGWEQAVRAHIETAGSEGVAGYFRFRLDDDAEAARRLERIVAWRCRRLGLPYGDQGLLIHRRLYEQAGGFKPIPLMEDVDLVRRIGRRRLALLDGTALTSASRYRRDGYWRRPARNLFLLSLYFLGVSPKILVRAYG
jgi:rSAM/selenodomain-associated transferase 2